MELRECVSVTKYTHVDGLTTIHETKIGKYGVLCKCCGYLQRRYINYTFTGSCEAKDDQDIFEIDPLFTTQEGCPRCGGTNEFALIDPNMVLIIKILNDAGLRTRNCCEGHGNGDSAYVQFDKNVSEEMFDILPELPPRWTLKMYNYGEGVKEDFRHAISIECEDGVGWDNDDKEEYLYQLLDWAQRVENGERRDV